jgi:hypothetical protein
VVEASSLGSEENSKYCLTRWQKD